MPPCSRYNEYIHLSAAGGSVRYDPTDLVLKLPSNFSLHNSDLSAGVHVCVCVTAGAVL